MGKGIDNKKLVKRSEKVAFMEIIGENKTSTFELMEGFTDMTFSKNPKEYSRGYVDEDTDRTDLTGYVESISYTLDRYKEQAAVEEIVRITEEELTGTDAVRRIIVVDKTTATGHGNGVLHAQARIRAYAVVPDSNGGTRDCMTYSGNFKSHGEKENIIVTTSDNWQTVNIFTSEETVLDI